MNINFIKLHKQKKPRKTLTSIRLEGHKGRNYRSSVVGGSEWRVSAVGAGQCRFVFPRVLPRTQLGPVRNITLVPSACILCICLLFRRYHLHSGTLQGAEIAPRLLQQP